MKTPLTLLILGCFVAGGFAQVDTKQRLDDGKKFFWQARFDQAVEALTEVTKIEGATAEQLFEAYLHLGFALTRQNAPDSEIDFAFEQAVRNNPQQKLNESFFPPDLTQRFYQVRDRLVGCILVVCDHPDVNIIAVDNDSILFTKTTPATICDLPEKSYQIFVTEQGYQEEFRRLSFTPGVTDTLYIELIPSVLQAGGEQGGSGVWKWLAGGGIVAGAAAVLYTTVIDKGDDTTTNGNNQTLPGPPVRPTIP